jgi:hypothetical protein
MNLTEFLEDRPFFKQIINNKSITGCEIGTESGNNALNMLTHLDIKHIILIDPFLNYGNMCGGGVLETPEIATSCKNYAFNLLSDFIDKITWIIDFSENEASNIENESLDFVYIDGNHRFEYVQKDIELYYPKIKYGGWLSGHDFKNGEPGVKQAVIEFCKSNNLVFYNQKWDWWIHKNEQ